jgi:hypothetical protein
MGKAEFNLYSPATLPHATAAAPPPPPPPPRCRTPSSAVISTGTKMSDSPPAAVGNAPPASPKSHQTPVAHQHQTVFLARVTPRRPPETPVVWC